MPGVPPQVTGPLLILGSAVLLSVAIKDTLDCQKGKKRAKIPLHNPKAFRFDLPGSTAGRTGSTAGGSSAPSSSQQK